MKVCVACKRELPEAAFGRSGTTADGLMHICRDCHARRVADGLRTFVARGGVLGRGRGRRAGGAGEGSETEG